MTARRPEAPSRTDCWPLLPSERTWGALRLGAVLATTAAATWCYIIGEYVGYYLPLRAGFAAMTAGGMLGMAIVAVAVMPTSMRYGIDSIAAAKPQFGARGWFFVVGVQYVSSFGWHSLLLIFFGKTVAQLLNAFGLTASSALIVPLTMLIACTVIVLALRRGSAGIDRLSRILVAHVFVGFWLLYVLVTRQWDRLSAAVPAQMHADPLWNYTTGVEIGLVSVISWWPSLGALLRLAPSARVAAAPAMLGLGLPVPLLSTIGLAGILALGTSDPSLWLLEAGGPVYGVIGLLFVAAANIGTAAVGIYTTSIGLRHFRLLDGIPWLGVVFLNAVPVGLVGLIAPDWFFDNFGSFLAFLGVMFSPICGIQITDYFLLRRGRIDVRAIYDGTPRGAYWFWGGVNPAAAAGMAAGFATYVYLLDPLTYESRPPYQYLTASLPACLVASLIYATVTKLLVQPAGRGGYAHAATARPGISARRQ